METQDNTGLGLIIASGERVKNKNSLFSSALKKLVNFTEEDLDNFLNANRKEKKEMTILRRIYSSESLHIGNLKGNRFFIQSESIFTDGIEENSSYLKLLTEVVPSSADNMIVFEALIDNTAYGLFKAVPGNWCTKYLTQDQIIYFCEKYPNMLGEGKSVTLFLCKIDNYMVAENRPWDNLIIVLVSNRNKKLRVSFDNLCSLMTILSRGKHRLVCPVI